MSITAWMLTTRLGKDHHESIDFDISLDSGITQSWAWNTRIELPKSPGGGEGGAPLVLPSRRSLKHESIGYCDSIWYGI